MSAEALSFNWKCRHTWKRSAKNTAWCLLGCAIGDFGTILFFQITKIPFSSSKYYDLGNYKWINNQYYFRNIYFDETKFFISKSIKDSIGNELYFYD
tara:strand:+ start:279 stop:569 length:291 start_codon:yes stop_codon:yes gene_type:complete